MTQGETAMIVQDLLELVSCKSFEEWCKQKGHDPALEYRWGLMSTTGARNKGFCAACDGVGIDAFWGGGGNPYSICEVELPFWLSWREGWMMAKS
jgi:hypothetical protein